MSEARNYIKNLHDCASQMGTGGCTKEMILSQFAMIVAQLNQTHTDLEGLEHIVDSLEMPTNVDSLLMPSIVDNDPDRLVQYQSRAESKPFEVIFPTTEVPTTESATESPSSPTDLVVGLCVLFFLLNELALVLAIVLNGGRGLAAVGAEIREIREKATMKRRWNPREDSEAASTASIGVLTKQMGELGEDMRAQQELIKELVMRSKVQIIEHLEEKTIAIVGEVSSPVQPADMSISSTATSHNVPINEPSTIARSAQLEEPLLGDVPESVAKIDKQPQWISMFWLALLVLNLVFISWIWFYHTGILIGSGHHNTYPLEDHNQDFNSMYWNNMATEMLSITTEMSTMATCVEDTSCDMFMSPLYNGVADMFESLFSPPHLKATATESV